MSIPIVTIPETAYNPAGYTARHGRQSRLLRFMLLLTRSSAGALVLAYLIGIFALRPLMTKAVVQRTEFVETCRLRLRALYLNAIGRVEYIPAVGIEKTKNGERKIYADAVCQTKDLNEKENAVSPKESLGVDGVVDKLKELRDKLVACRLHMGQDLEYFKIVDFSVKDLRQKTDLVHFDQTKLFNETGAQSSRKPRNLAREVKQEIRSVKGMFMSGRA